MRSRLLSLPAVLALGVVSLAPAADDKKFPRPGSEVPGSFCPLVINGGWKDEQGKSVPRYHSVVTAFGLRPVVLVFARDPKDQAVWDFLKKLDAKVGDNQELELRGCAVFLALDDKRDKTDASVKELITAANERDDLVQALKNNAQGLKHVLVGLDSPKGPRGYQIAEKTYVEVLLYDRLQVAAAHAYEIGDKENKEAGFGSKAQARVLKEVDDLVAAVKKKRRAAARE